MPTQTQLPPAQAEQPRDVWDALTDVSAGIDRQFPVERLPGFPAHPDTEAVPIQEQGAPRDRSAADRFFGSDLDIADINSKPGWVARAKERMSNARTGIVLAVGAVGLVAASALPGWQVVKPTERGPRPDKTDEPTPQFSATAVLPEISSPPRVTAPGENTLGEGYNATRERAAKVNFTIKGLVSGEHWEVQHMNVQQTPLEKARAAAHNLLVPGQIDGTVLDPRLPEVIGHDADSKSRELFAQYGDSLQMDIVGDQPTEKITPNGIVVGATVAFRTTANQPFQGLRHPDVTTQGVEQAEFIFIDPDGDGEYTLSGATFEPAPDATVAIGQNNARD